MPNTLDFLVIGAQKAGTTTLHALLSQHPDLWLPVEKEAPYFVFPDVWERGLEPLIAFAFDDAPPDRVWGKVTPHYMKGAPGAPTAEVSRRVKTVVPDVRLIALLRDPIRRAISQWRMMVRRGSESRTFEAAICESLETVEADRENPETTNAYVIQGEYGRILRAWLEHFPQRQLHIGYLDDLESDPQATISPIFHHIGVTDLEIEPTERLNRSGSGVRVSSQDVFRLRQLLDRHVWRGSSTSMRRAFNYWFNMWNVIPDESLPQLSGTTSHRLTNHYRHDLEILRTIDVAVPEAWLTEYA